MHKHGRHAIEEAIVRRKEQHQAAFIPFVMAGDPTFEESLGIILKMAEFSDVIEVGIPYSDPLADGPVIQASALRALADSMTMERAFTLFQAIREKTEVPLIAFTYVNPVLQYGYAEMAKKLAQIGVDGMIVPDLPYEESEPLQQALATYDLALIPLIALTSKERIQKIAQSASGFAYCVSSLGVTGERSQFASDLQAFVQTVSSHSSVPVAVGFGVKEPAQVHELRAYADGVIVGSALVRLIGAIDEAKRSGDQRQVEAAYEQLFTLAQNLAQATR